MTAVSHEGETRLLEVGKTIFDYADELAVEVPTSCQRTGECHECVVEIKTGMEALVDPTESERFLRDDYRLACQASILLDNVDIEFAPLRRRPRILEPEPRKTDTGDMSPMVTCQNDEIYYGDLVIDRFRNKYFGLAVDLGTTTVVLELVDLATGISAAVASFENPQRFGGSDIMNRISYDTENGAHGELQKAVVTAINEGIRDMCRQVGIRPPHIYEIVVAGNSTMRDILFGLDVQSIGQKPYKSQIEYEFLEGLRETTALTVDTRSVGLRANRNAKLHGLPLIASHVGADAAACLAAIDLTTGGETAMLVDMGTNTEVVLHHEGEFYAASCPAGPAFEGGLVTYGMSAYDGAIESIQLAADGTAAKYSTIGDVPALGLCGSGLIDLLAEVRRYEIMTPKGVFTDDRKRFDMTVVPDRGITFSKEDASNLAQAKAANYSGQLIVMRAAGINPADIKHLYLAGGFATYINVRNAIEIGLIAPVLEERVTKVGNASIDGARALLLSKEKRARLEELVKTVTHIELETTPDFFEIFVEGCQLYPMPAVLPQATAAGSVAQ